MYGADERTKAEYSEWDVGMYVGNDVTREIERQMMSR